MAVLAIKTHSSDGTSALWTKIGKNTGTLHKRIRYSKCEATVEKRWWQSGITRWRKWCARELRPAGATEIQNHTALKMCDYWQTQENRVTDHFMQTAGRLYRGWLWYVRPLCWCILHDEGYSACPGRTLWECCNAHHWRVYAWQLLLRLSVAVAKFHWALSPWWDFGLPLHG